MDNNFANIEGMFKANTDIVKKALDEADVAGPEKSLKQVNVTLTDAQSWPVCGWTARPTALRSPQA